MHHCIITNKELPAKWKPYRPPHAWSSEVDKQIQEMIDNGIIRPSSSPWNSPIILVKKKDSSIRFVCDFRGLNDVTKKIRILFHIFGMLSIECMALSSGLPEIQPPHTGQCH